MHKKDQQSQKPLHPLQLVVFLSPQLTSNLRSRVKGRYLAQRLGSALGNFQRGKAKKLQLVKLKSSIAS
ncbi:hypothetical protein FGO68_gene11244 [Halteria grandinella]|uniref:Uncharacterized protein n=1 Tax=Halteria grandinella TaxID=5974 RepID=A0A8J8NZC8_HALGN|nr:hypothetical protein FGO68_gene11244 [Halteria grandinella]